MESKKNKKDPFDYICDGQMSIDEWLNDTFPKQCCGVTPWLHKTKCCKWDPAKPQEYTMYYVCPICLKAPVDETGWTKYRHGTYDKAKKQALADWNDPEAKFEAKEYLNYVHCSISDYEEWEKLYGIPYKEYCKKKIAERENKNA